jgi:hypothetical protein
VNVRPGKALVVQAVGLVYAPDGVVDRLLVMPAAAQLAPELIPRVIPPAKEP